MTPECDRLHDELKELKSDPHNVYRKWKQSAQASLNKTEEKQDPDQSRKED